MLNPYHRQRSNFAAGAELETAAARGNSLKFSKASVADIIEVYKTRIEE
jgi:hypothetical protein